MALKLLTEAVWQKWVPPAHPTARFDGKTVLITGANTGLGFETAIKLVELGVDRLIVSSRDPTKGEGAKETIETRTGRPGVVEVWPLDMSSYASIHAFAERAATLEHFDVAILNAGVYMAAHRTSAYGWEETLQINALSTALLAFLMVPILRSKRRGSGVPVLEVVGSGRHQHLKVEDQLLHAPNVLQASNVTPDGFNGDYQYCLAKLYIQLVVQKLAALTRRTNGELDVQVLSVCVGAARSGIGRGFRTSALGNFVVSLFEFLMMRTTEEGSRSIVSGVSLGPEAHGRFWQYDEIRP